MYGALTIHGIKKSWQKYFFENFPYILSDLDIVHVILESINASISRISCECSINCIVWSNFDKKNYYTLWNIIKYNTNVKHAKFSKSEIITLIKFILENTSTLDFCKMYTRHHKNIPIKVQF